MIALDTNIMVYARRAETPQHAKARDLLQSLAEGNDPWVLFWPCVYEFLRVVTHPRVFDPPSVLDEVLEDLASLVESSSLTLLGEGPSHFSHLQRTLTSGRATGNLAHDGHIAGLAIEHGVSELLTADRDFARFPALKIRNPFA